LNVYSFFDNIREATEEEVKNLRGIENSKREIIEEVNNAINAINEIEGIRGNFEITNDSVPAIADLEGRMDEAGNEEEVEEIKYDIHEAICGHLRSSLKVLANRSNV